jgi:maleylacetoacetate isomerase
MVSKSELSQDIMMAKTFTLYSYYRSSCSARVRIAAHLKGIDLKYSFIHLLKDDQNSEQYGQVNPSHSVPTLIISEDGAEDIVIRQSIAILEYFEEIGGESAVSLLPEDPVNRAKVRELVDIVSCDIQPVTNLRVIQRIKTAGLDVGEWQKHFMTSGLLAYETLVSKYSGKLSVDDSVTMADVVLAPAIDNAIRFDAFDPDQMPTIKRIVDEYNKIDAFKAGSWRNQPDTPDEFRT